MLYPQSNPFRQLVDLSGIWDFRVDPEGVGEHEGWCRGLGACRPIAVPASWNDQFVDMRDYLGLAWYQTSFDLPWGWNGKKICLRFGSVNYLASVWVNGEFAGKHEGGHLPFEFDISPCVRPRANQLVVCVDGGLAPDRVPPGNVPPDARDVFANQNFPPASFDFFPFCGIHRPVLITARHREGIDSIQVTTNVDGARGEVAVKIWCGATAAAVNVQISGHGTQSSTEVAVSDGQAATVISIADAALWEPGAPNL